MNTPRNNPDEQNIEINELLYHRKINFYFNGIHLPHNQKLRIKKGENIFFCVPNTPQEESGEMEYFTPYPDRQERQHFSLRIDSIKRGEEPHIFFLSGPIVHTSMEKLPGTIQVVVEYPKESAASPVIVQRDPPTEKAAFTSEHYNPYQPLDIQTNEAPGLIERLRKLFKR